MRIIMKFDDKYYDFQNRFRNGTDDVMLIVRPDADGKLKINGIFPNGISESDLKRAISKNDKINLEIIAHTRAGGKTFQSDRTDKYPVVRVAVDELTNWIEGNLLKNNLQKSTISLLTCQAAQSGRYEAASIAESMLRLFNSSKPKKITAREGYTYIDPGPQGVHSHGTLATAAQQITKKLPPILSFYKYLPKGLDPQDKFAFTYNENSNQYFKTDIIFYRFFNLVKEDSINNLDIYDHKLMEILSKPFEQINANDVKKLLDLVKSKKEHFKSLDQSRKENHKVLPKFEIMKNHYKDMLPIALNGHAATFELKEVMMYSVDTLIEIARKNENLISSREIVGLLEETKEYINYRQLRNYDISSIQALINMTGYIIDNDGYVTPKDKEILQNIGNSFKDAIFKDSKTRALSTSIGELKMYKEIYTVTKTKNLNFRNIIVEFSDKLNVLDPEIKPPKNKIR